MQSRAEALLVFAGFALPLLLFALYLWGLGNLAQDLDAATDSRNNTTPSAGVQFNLKPAMDILRKRGLLQ
jgi:hypothetical protein